MNLHSKYHYTIILSIRRYQRKSIYQKNKVLLLIISITSIGISTRKEAQSKLQWISFHNAQQFEASKQLSNHRHEKPLEQRMPSFHRAVNEATRRKTHRWVSERQAVGGSWVSERQESRVRAVLICRVYYSVDVAPDTSAPSVFWPMSAPWLPSTSVSYVSLFHVRLLCTKVHVSGSGILAKRRSRMRPGIRRNISADCLSCFYLLRANERNGLGRKQKKGIRGLDGGKRRDAYALFFFFPWQTRTSALGLGRGITKDLSICQFRRSPASKVRRRGHQMHFIMPLLGDASWLRG